MVCDKSDQSLVTIVCVYRPSVRIGSFVSTKTKSIPIEIEWTRDMKMEGNVAIIKIDFRWWFFTKNCSDNSHNIYSFYWTFFFLKKWKLIIMLDLRHRTIQIWDFQVKNTSVNKQANSFYKLSQIIINSVFANISNIFRRKVWTLFFSKVDSNFFFCKRERRMSLKQFLQLGKVVWALGSQLN